MRKLLVLMCFACVLAASAQDAVQSDPKHFKVEYQDVKTRVVREILPPGETAPMHSHPERITVAVRGGKLRITDANGRSQVVEVKTGDVEHIDAQTHTVTNIGSTVFEEVSTEFVTPAGKQPPEAIVPSRPNDAVDRAPLSEAPAPKPKAQAETVAPKTPEPAVAAERPKPTPTAPSQQSQQPAAQQPIQESAAAQLEQPVVVTSPIKGAKTIQVNGQDLAYVERGEGEPLILVHGNGADLRNWSKQIDEFAQHYRVIAYSRRCHYPNTCTGREDDYTYAQHAKDLLAFMDALKIQKASVIGHSYGASVVGIAATMQPERFTSIVVAEPSFRNLLPQIQADQAQYSQNQIHAMMRKMFVKQHNLEAAMQIYAEWVRTGFWDEMDPMTKQSMLDNGKAMIAYTAHSEAPAFVCETAKKLTMPMLVVYGEESPPNNRIISSTLAECATKAKRAVIPNAMHTMHRQNPEAFNKAVLEFLATTK
jgi:pimeloyl-ACP methyl ester carboxylesterase/quercetin dioxygenase-like cupin family protein